jgi:hypothetical protein
MYQTIDPAGSIWSCIRDVIMNKLIDLAVLIVRAICFAFVFGLAKIGSEALLENINHHVAIFGSWIVLYVVLWWMSRNRPFDLALGALFYIPIMIGGVIALAAGVPMEHFTIDALTVAMIWWFAWPVVRKMYPSRPAATALKDTPTAMDAIIKLTYGNSPPQKSANLQEATELSCKTLLGNVVDIAEVREIATELYNGPMPYSTHDLAVATAMNLFRGANRDRHEELARIQLLSRMTVLDWVKARKLNPLIAKTFEDSLYKLYKPVAPVAKIDHEMQPKPFYINRTREERREWLAHTPPWDRLAPVVIDAILNGITDKVLLEAFVLTSMEQNLVDRYEQLGRENDGPTVIRAQISQILSETGFRVIGSLEKALKAKQMDAAGNTAALAANIFEPAIALAKDQVAAYFGMAHLCRLGGKREECHDWAKRGLAELDEMRPYKSAMQRSTVLPTDLFDQEEKYLRMILEY